MVFDRRKLIEMLLMLGPYQHTGGGENCIFCGEEPEGHKPECVWRVFEAAAEDAIPELTVEGVKAVLASSAVGAQELHDALKNKINVLRQKRLMGRNLKFTREEALAWSREHLGVPDELVFGYPLHPAPADSVQRKPLTYEEIVALVEEVGPLPSVLAASEPLGTEICPECEEDCRQGYHKKGCSKCGHSNKGGLFGPECIGCGMILPVKKE